MTSVAVRAITASEFLFMDHGGRELVDGEIQEINMGVQSAWIGKKIVDHLTAFVEPAGRGVVMPQETGIDLRPWGGSTVRKPDGMFVARAKMAGRKLPTGWLDVVPDLAVEVVSPGDRVEELERKLSDYRSAAIRLVWVVYPSNRTARIQRADGSVDFIDADGYLDGEDVLPGFRVQLGEIFDAADAITR